jgi:Arm DNA-binding domain
MRGQITKRSVDALKPAATEYFLWDKKLAGFGVRVQTTGVRSYVVKYRAGSGRSTPTRRVTLGALGKLTPDEARKLAKSPFRNSVRTRLHGLFGTAERAKSGV